MKIDRDKPVLITGGAGFIGSNLADRLARQGRRVRIMDSLVRDGTQRNLQWLKQGHGELIDVVLADIRDFTQVDAAIKGVEAVFHFAAQTAVTNSLADPHTDFESNVRGTFNILESIRRTAPHTPVLFASTNKVYGELDDLALELGAIGYQPVDPSRHFSGIGEERALSFRTPYGCSKGAADQYVLDYANSYGVRAAVIRMSCVYGPRQYGNEDQGWVAHFLINALKDCPITIFGNGWQVRDICTVDDTCAMYCAALNHIDEIAGRAFNWGGGRDNAVSLRQVLHEIATITGRIPATRFQAWRGGDQRWFVADTREIDAALELAPRTGWRAGLRELARWLSKDARMASPPVPAPTPARVAI